MGCKWKTVWNSRIFVQFLCWNSCAGPNSQPMISKMEERSKFGLCTWVGCHSVVVTQSLKFILCQKWVGNSDFFCQTFDWSIVDAMPSIFMAGFPLFHFRAVIECHLEGFLPLQVNPCSHYLNYIGNKTGDFPSQSRPFQQWWGVSHHTRSMLASHSEI